MIIFIKVVLFGLMFGAAWQFISLVLKMPTIATRKTLLASGSKRGSEKNAAAALELSRYIRLSPEKKKNIEEAILRGKLGVTAELFIAQNIVVHAPTFGLAMFMAGLALIFSGVIRMLFFAGAAAILFVTIRSFAKNSKNTDFALKKTREIIEGELYRFVCCISDEIQTNHDVLSIFERHRESFSPEFTEELTITIADMRSGNYIAALSRLSRRVGSPDLSEICRVLSDMATGVDTSFYWSALRESLMKKQEQRLMIEAGKIPVKVNGLCFGLLGCLMILVVGVMGFNLLQMLPALFA